MAENIVTPDAIEEPALEPVSAEAYMERYAHDYYEWVEGELFKMHPVSLRHDDLSQYLADIFRAYFALNPIGIVRLAPFVMRVDATKSRREPDLQVILESNPGDLTDTAMVGPADICVEIVSLESAARDRGEKFIEYEKGGVKEYWLIDPHHEEAIFYRLNEKEIYKSIALDKSGDYQTPALPGLRLHVPTLWQEKLPGIISIVESVRGMLEE